MNLLAPELVTLLTSGLAQFITVISPGPCFLITAQTAVALFFGSGPVRTFYLRAKVWIDRATELFVGALGLQLL